MLPDGVECRYTPQCSHLPYLAVDMIPYGLTNYNFFLLHLTIIAVIIALLVFSPHTSYVCVHVQCVCICVYNVCVCRQQCTTTLSSLGTFTVSRE